MVTFRETRHIDESILKERYAIIIIPSVVAAGLKVEAAGLLNRSKADHFETSKPKPKQWL
jgi:hypothetical protein